MLRHQNLFIIMEDNKMSDKIQGPKVFKTKDDKKNFTQEEVKKQQKIWRPLLNEKNENKKYFPNYFYAGFWIRMFAYCLDLMCIHAITNATVGLTYRVAAVEIATNFLSFSSLLSLAIYLAYFTLLTKLNHGQTIGKMVFGIRVVSLSETELSWGTVIVRETVCRFILKGFPFVLGYIVAAFTDHKQHVGDYFSDTSVITINVLKAFNKELRA